MIDLQSDQKAVHQLVARGWLEVLHSEPDVVADVEMREQRVVLEHQAHSPLLRGERVSGSGHRLASDQHRALVERLDPGDQTQDGALAATRGPEQAGYPPGLQRETRSAHDCARAIAARHPAQGQDRVGVHGSSL